MISIVSIPFGIALGALGLYAYLKFKGKCVKQCECGEQETCPSENEIA